MSPRTPTETRPRKVLVPEKHARLALCLAVEGTEKDISSYMLGLRADKKKSHAFIAKVQRRTCHAKSTKRHY
eukprot:3275440-Amphidinium_carterae.1